MVIDCARTAVYSAAMNTREKGDYSELVVLAEMHRLGYRVAIPYGNSQGFDLLALGDGGRRWLTIQVKTAHRRGARNGSIYVDTIRGTSLNKKRGYGEGSFDFMVATIPDERLFWVIPFEEMRGRRCLTMKPDRPCNWGMI